MSLRLDKKFMFLVLFAAGLAAFAAENAEAASSPVFLFAWQADSYAPFDFQGKILPVEKSYITVSLSLIDGNRMIDLSGKRILWFINGELMADKPGQASFSFKNRKSSGSVNTVEARIANYNSSLLKDSVDIPVSSPKLVISSPYNKGSLASKNISLTALPYFFSIKSLSDLKYSWSVNGKQPSGSASNPNSLSITIPDEVPSGSAVEVDAIAQNLKNAFETAVKKITYIVQ